MNTTQIKNFHNLIAIMADLPDTRGLDMDCYHKCGTPSCVLGHYAARRDIQNTFYLGKTHSLCITGDPTGRHIHFNDTTVLNEFGITHCDATDLFDGDRLGDSRYPKPSEVVEYLIEFLKTKGITT